jgi:hypothetical protein
MTCGNRSREKKIKGYTLKGGDIDKPVYLNTYGEMLNDMTTGTWNKKPDSPDIWNKKPVASNKTHDLPDDEIIVPVQTMFPNCQKYDPCCTESGTEKMMKRFNKMIEKPIERISHKANKGNRIKIIKRVKPVKKNPFPDEDVLGEGV